MAQLLCINWSWPFNFSHLSGVAEWLAIDFHHTVGLTSDMFSYVTKFRSLNTLTKKEFPTTTKPPWSFYWKTPGWSYDVFDVWKGFLICMSGWCRTFFFSQKNICAGKICLDLTKKVPLPTFDGSEILQATVEAGSLSYYLHGLIHPRRWSTVLQESVVPSSRTKKSESSPSPPFRTNKVPFTFKIKVNPRCQAILGEDSVYSTHTLLRYLQWPDAKVAQFFVHTIHPIHCRSLIF